MTFYERIDATTSNLQPASTFSAKVDAMQLSLTQTFSNTGVKSKSLPFIYLLKQKLNGGRKRTLAKIHPDCICVYIYVMFSF